jgi:competence ComEA-like helix-hairpin-helix protein
MAGVNQMVAGAGQTADDQDTETKKLVERTCTRCHTLVNTYRMRNTRERWSEIVDDMVSRGADATDDEIEQIIDFLATNYGPKVNVNKASAQELSRSLGLSATAAKSIVDYRTKKGAFENIADLKAVPDVDWKTIESQKDRIEFLK